MGDSLGNRAEVLRTWEGTERGRAIGKQSDSLFCGLLYRCSGDANNHYTAAVVEQPGVDSRVTPALAGCYDMMHFFRIFSIVFAVWYKDYVAVWSR